MRYIVITAKHHDGFCLFNTKSTDYNCFAGAAGRDLVAELSAACAKEKLGLGLYFSWIDWHCPDALPFSDHNSDIIPEAHQKMNLVQMEELLSHYGPVCELWFDMGSPTKQQSREMRNLVRKLQPDAMINGRIWNNEEDFIVLADNEIPEFSMDSPWQTPASIYCETWGYRSWQKRGNLKEKIGEQIRNLTTVSALGGNYLLNIGPMGDGSVVPFEREVLEGIGRWLRQNNEAVFGVAPGYREDEVWGYSARRGDSLYLQIHRFPADGKIPLKGLATRPLSASYLADESLPCFIESGEDGFYLQLRTQDEQPDLTMIKLLFDVAPRMNTENEITGDGTFNLKGQNQWTYQGKEYYSCKPLVSGKSWVCRAASDGMLSLDLECLKGQTVEIKTSGAVGEGGEIQGLDSKLSLNAKLKSATC